MEPDRAAERVRAWLAARNPEGVVFEERFDPEAEPVEGYRVAYEATFTPASLTRARVEVWVTDSGFVAFGFDRWKRVAERLGRRGGFEWFAAGSEPVSMSESQLASLLDLSADGRISLWVASAPLFGLLTMRALVAGGTKERDGLGGRSFDWLRERAPLVPALGRILEYEPW